MNLVIHRCPYHFRRFPNTVLLRRIDGTAASGVLAFSQRLFSSDSQKNPPAKDRSPAESPKNKALSDRVGQQQDSYIDQILLRGEQEEEAKTTAQKVKKKAANTFFYIVLAGSATFLCAIAYYLGREFLTLQSPNRIYSKALKMIRNDDRCHDLFGDKISAHGEESGRRRRRALANRAYVKDGQERVRVMFHVKGEKNTGKAVAEVAKIGGSWQFRFLTVETNAMVPETVVVLDNR